MLSRENANYGGEARGYTIVRWFSGECGGGAGQRMAAQAGSCAAWGSGEESGRGGRICEMARLQSAIRVSRAPVSSLLPATKSQQRGLVEVEIGARTSFAEGMAPFLERLEIGQHVLQGSHGRNPEDIKVRRPW